MITFQLRKILNNTEVGGRNTNDSYVYFKSAYKSFFPNIVNQQIIFIDRQTNEKVILHVTFGVECRLNGLGEYVRGKKLKSGDEIFLERTVVDESRTEWVIDYVKKKNDLFVLEYYKKEGCFIPWDEVEFSQQIVESRTLDTTYDGKLFKLKIDYYKKLKRRSDSPLEYDGYLIENLDQLFDLSRLKNDHRIFIDIIGQATCTISLQTINWEYQIISY